MARLLPATRNEGDLPQMEGLEQRESKETLPQLHGLLRSHGFADLDDLAGALKADHD